MHPESPVHQQPRLYARLPQIEIFLCVFDHVARWGKPILRNRYWRCYLPVTAGASLRYAGQTRPMGIDEVLIIPPDCPVQGEAETPFSLYYAHFHCPLRLKQPLVYRSPGAADLRAILDEAVASRSEHRLCMAMLQLVASGLGAIPAHDIQHSVTDEHTTRAYQIMQEHLDARLANHDLARQLNLSEASLLRLFRTTTGRSPQKEHLLIRLNHAADLLRNSDDSIDQIAAACGFWDRNHFTRVFTREWKLPPARYRHSATPL